MNLNKLFLPLSVTNRIKRTTRVKDNVRGTLYNYAYSFAELLRMALTSGDVKTNYITITTMNIENDGNLETAVAVPSNSSVVNVNSSDTVSVVMPTVDLGIDITMNNTSEAADLLIFSQGNDTVGYESNESGITIAAGDSLRFVGESNTNWATL